jgi:hypothetical protein
VGGHRHDDRVQVEQLSLAQARRIALRSQGLDRPRAARGTPTARHLDGVLDRTGVLQIDSVNVFARAHLMPAFSRLGPYDTGLLDRAAGRAPRHLVEAWAHQASYVPPATYRMLGWRHRAWLTEAWGSIREVPVQHAPVVADVRAMVAERGPLTAAAIHAELAGQHPRGRAVEWGWNWTVAKRALEYLFFTGELTSAGRTPAFERRYDLVERVLPPQVRDSPEPADADAERALVEIAARAHGVATLRCLADYFRMRQDRTAAAVATLVEDGLLVPVEVIGWGRAYLHGSASVPRRATGRALLSPFDPLVFERRRLAALFGLHYRIEIYTPAPRRVWGYYVLPFLLGDQLAALVDLKADRAGGVLRVAAAHRAPLAAVAGPPVREPELVGALAAELALAARWLGLQTVRADGAAGDLAVALAAELARDPAT